MNTKVIAIIPAKGISTRLAGKNMRYLLGKTLLEHAIDYIKESTRITRFYVSTDDEIIAETGRSLKAEIIMRPTRLTGDTPLVEVYRHALAGLDIDQIEVMAGVQVDHPDRNISLDEALERFESEQADRLYSIDAQGKKNGAHLIMKVAAVQRNKFEKEKSIIDEFYRALLFFSNVFDPATFCKTNTRIQFL